jgi:hypothetical protein
MRGGGTPPPRPVTAVTVSELRAHLAAGAFGSGSMAPKVEAVCRFAETTGRPAAITSLARISEAVAGTGGTVVQPGPAQAGRRPDAGGQTPATSRPLTNQPLNPPTADQRGARRA